MNESVCCGAEIKVLETGVLGAGQWTEVECQQCGSIYFLDEEVGD